MNNPEWDIISSAYCLNLERNIQRWVDSSIQFHNVGLHDVERINCIETVGHSGPPHNYPLRFLSFNKSHYDAVKKGHETGKPFVIFEDDIIFDPIWKHIAEATSELPEDWQALYLGANICGEWELPHKHSAHLSRMPNGWMTHAIMYSMTGARFVLDNFNPDTMITYDEWLRVNLMPFGNVYLLTPMSCYQRPGYSDIWKTDVEYGTHGPGNKILKRIHQPGIVI